MLKFLHTSDIHLGAKLGWLKDKASKQRNQTFSTFENIVDMAISERVDVVLVAGDLFDSPTPDSPTVKFVIHQLTQLTENGMHTIISPGNHDYFESHGVYANWKIPPNIYVFSKTKPEVFEIPELKLRVYGQSIRSNKQNPDFNEIVELFEQTGEWVYNIGVYHGPVRFGGRKEGVDERSIEESGFDYVALGDWHGFLKYTNKSYYPGSPEPLAIDQNNSGHCIVGNIDKTNLDIQKISVGKLEVIEDKIKITGENGFGDISNFLKGKAKQNLALKLTIKGMTDPVRPIDIAQLVDSYSDKFFYLQIEDQTTLDLSENLMQQYPDELLVGRFIKLVKARIEDTTDETQKEMLRQVLKEGIRRLVQNEY